MEGKTGNGKQLREQAALLQTGITAFEKRLARQRQLYSQLLAHAKRHGGRGTIVAVSDPVLFAKTIEAFGPAISPGVDVCSVRKIFNAAVDSITGTVIVANAGATLFCHSPRGGTPYITRHIGMALYIPGLGIETVNVGLSGDVYDGPVVCRCESACTPSFLFGSQRCNCAHQWDSFRELAAFFNPVHPPRNQDGPAFEKWVQRQVKCRGGRHVFRNHGLGFIAIHIDSQNGMGSGATEGEFAVDLFSRASLRHRGEYSAEQILKTSIDRKSVV